jgi:hypothetical protein
MSFSVPLSMRGGFSAMNKPPEPAPTGNWQMPNPNLAQMLGHFVMAWSLIEATIEIGIGKQLGTKSLETSIVTAGLMFRARASILMSLLNRDPSKNSEAIRLLKEVEGIEDRNDIMHSVIGGSVDQIWFNRRKTKNRFTSKIERYDQVRLNSTVLNIADLSGELMKALGISRPDYLEFFQQSHNAANNSSVSP